MKARKKAQQWLVIQPIQRHLPHTIDVFDHVCSALVYETANLLTIPNEIRNAVAHPL